MVNVKFARFWQQDSDIELDVSPDETILDLKRRIAGHFRVQPYRQNLILGTPLANHRTVAQSNILNNTQLMVVINTSMFITVALHLRLENFDQLPFRLIVKPETTVSDVLEMLRTVAADSNINLGRFSLYYAGDRVTNGEEKLNITLADLNIYNGATLDLFRLDYAQLNVNVRSHTGERTENVAGLNGGHTIHALKEHTRLSFGIAADQQIDLSFLGRHLKYDHVAIAQSFVHSGAMVDMLGPQTAQDLQLSIRVNMLPSPRVVQVPEVFATTTVSELKQRATQLEDIPFELQLLSYPLYQLRQNDPPLSWHKVVRPGSTLDLTVCGVKLNVLTPTGVANSIPIWVRYKDTTESLKQKITEVDPSLPKDMMILSLDGEELEDARTMESHDIHSNFDILCTIDKQKKKMEIVPDATEKSKVSEKRKGADHGTSAVRPFKK